MKPLYLKFDSKIEMETVLLGNGFVKDTANDRMIPPNNILLDIIGVIPGKILVDGQGNVLSQEPDLPGWHVNLLVPDDYVIQQPNAVVTVATPVRKWAGY
ncbi:hypothetical protein [Edwardsiella tarda]|uniref:hypothetical protein n=1 Tax=Edwardsiella tarda TaxID=636 RepID=UPI0009900412|nr:hypothetical protein [Edwardsiella tarda]